MTSTAAIPEHKVFENTNSRSIEIGDWYIAAKTNPISNAAECDALQVSLSGLPLPEMTFGNNSLELVHRPSGWSYAFTTADALRGVKNGELAEGDGGVKVGYAEAWLQSRTGPSSQLPMPKTVPTKPYDWTYTTMYCGHEKCSLPSTSWHPADPDNTSHAIPIAELTRQDPILFYAEIPLFEDELHDNGASHLLVRIRVMPTCLFILCRFTLRVDNVLFRTYDTRLYHSFSSSPPFVVKETSGWEAPYERVKRHLRRRDDLTPLTDPTWIASILTKLPAEATQLAGAAILVEKDIPLEIDTGFLTVTDLNPVDAESYSADLEDYLMSTARDGVQTLLASLFDLPTTPSEDGPVAQLPPPTTQLPRAKPLPKPKPLTKWEKFANAKGIQKKRKDKKEWDEERQEWVDRWGWKGANKKEETQWLTEVPANADADFDPSKAVRDARKERVAKNEKQRLQNLARAQQEGSTSSGPLVTKDQRKTDINRTLATTRVSTASMGRFDRALEGEKKLKGVKRKFEPTELSSTAEKSQNMAILSKIEREPAARKSKGDDVLNVRKAVRMASKGKGSAALARESEGSKRKGKRR
ncbi:hypothetical protein NM688_g4452 [Phlebia brevispora]|uniref:Uncharacterized protein n=1 Tax=Phlebia brevispora TaxID=194682 RepID=A0ACC1T317_9APHY|nr:hypothetical protein NM688_g4452 [Phlebia brevispora]